MQDSREAQLFELLGGQPQLLAEENRIGDHPPDVPAGVGVAPLDGLGERRDHLEELALLLGVETGVGDGGGERPGEELHPPKIVRIEPVPTHAVEELQHADDPPPGDERHGQHAAGGEARVRVAAPARIAGHRVDDLGLAGERHVADDAPPARHPQRLDLGAARPRTTLKNSSPDSSSSSQIELDSAWQSSSAFCNARASTRPRSSVLASWTPNSSSVSYSASRRVVSAVRVMSRPGSLLPVGSLPDRTRGPGQNRGPIQKAVSNPSPSDSSKSQTRAKSQWRSSPLKRIVSPQP